MVFLTHECCDPEVPPGPGGSPVRVGMTMLLPAVVVLAAGILTGMTGFGFSVLAVPLLVMSYPPHEVVVIVLFLVPVTSLTLVLTPHLRGQVQLQLCARLGALSALGLPLGVALFARSDPVWLSVLIGVVLVGFAGFNLCSPEAWRVPAPLVVPSGLLGGVLATSTGLSGPAVAMYVHGRRLAHGERVATMAAYVGAVSVLGLAAMALHAEVPEGTLATVAWLAPAAVAGVGLGRWWARRYHQNIERYTMYALALMGLATIVRAVTG